jgi:hypothetical protein
VLKNAFSNQLQELGDPITSSSEWRRFMLQHPSEWKEMCGKLHTSHDSRRTSKSGIAVRTHSRALRRQP